MLNSHNFILYDIVTFLRGKLSSLTMSLPHIIPLLSFHDPAFLLCGSEGGNQACNWCIDPFLQVPVDSQLVSEPTLKCTNTVSKGVVVWNPVTWTDETTFLCQMKHF